MTEVTKFSFVDAAGVHLEIGTDTGLHKILVHEDLVCKASPVLKAAFQGNFLESQKKSFTLEDIDLPTANNFVQWLYARQSFEFVGGAGIPLKDYFLSLAKLYICANKYMVADLLMPIERDIARTICSKIISHKAGGVPSADVISLIYRNTPASSVMRKLLASCYAAHVKMEVDKSGTLRPFLDNHPDFAIDLALASASRFHQRDKPCFLHEFSGIGTCNDIK